MMNMIKWLSFKCNLYIKKNHICGIHVSSRMEYSRYFLRVEVDVIGPFSSVLEII